MQDGLETGLNCGGPACQPCNLGLGCASDKDCFTRNCLGGKCAAPVCGNGKQDGDETGLDCGGPCIEKCPDGSACKTPKDCISGVCRGSVCQMPSCDDWVINQGEGPQTPDCGLVCQIACP